MTYAQNSKKGNPATIVCDLIIVEQSYTYKRVWFELRLGNNCSNNGGESNITEAKTNWLINGTQIS